MKMKTMFAAMAACAIAATSFAAMSLSASAADYTAVLNYATASWDIQYWGEGNSGNVNCTSADVAITGDGTYTVSMTADWEATGFSVFCIDIKDFVTAYPDATIAVSSVKADGTEVLTDASKVLTGDIEGKGILRAEIYNTYGSGTKDASPISDPTTLKYTTLDVTFSIANTGIVAETTAATTAAAATTTTAAAGAATTAATTAAGAATTTTKTATTNSASTGDAGVAVALTGLTLAGAVALVTKRK